MWSVVLGLGSGSKRRSGSERRCGSKRRSGQGMGGMWYWGEETVVDSEKWLRGGEVVMGVG